MSSTIIIRDETASGDVFHSFPLEFPSERIKVRDLIRERVYQEVDDFNRRDDSLYHGLVQPSEAERILNKDGKGHSYRVAKNRRIDWKEQFNLAIRSFQTNGFFILVDDKQVEDLDQEIVLGRGTEVSFVKLVPLVGG